MKNTRNAINRIFDDLDSYRNFCREYGHVFNESDLYNHTTAWSQYSKWRRGETVVNNWDRDRLNTTNH